MSVLTDANVPMLGQQITVIGYSVLPLVQCGCGATPMQLVAQNTSGQWHALAATCPKCQNVYQIHTVEADARGLLRFAIALSRPANA